MIKPSSLSARLTKQFLLTCSLLFSIATQCLSQTASFTADVTSGCFPLTVKFTDTSTGTISSWAWDFGNSNTSVFQHPSAVYTAPGTYTVTLKVSNGPQHHTKTGFIVVHDVPTVDFSFDKTSGCTPLTVNFTDKSTPGSGIITDWLWVFGDGGSSTASNPAYTYTTPGSKTITLKITNQFGCTRTLPKPAAITISGPSALFTPSSTEACQVPAAIAFTNQSTGNGTLTYSWNFGDGATSTAQDPSHTYTQAGTYSVVLKARDALGCESSNSISITAGGQGGLNFEPSALKVCAGDPISFVTQANATIISREWNFGNGTVSASADPSVTYSNAGTYQVKLTAMLQGNTCQSIVTKNIEVVAIPAPSFTYKADCNYKVSFTNTSTSASRIEWWYVQNGFVSSNANFDYSFPSSGTPTIKLIAYNSLGCSKVYETSINVPAKPVAAFDPSLQQDCIAPTLSGCAPFTLQLKDQSTSATAYTSSWQFGDGTTSTSTEKNPTHIYTAKGTYTLRLTITNAQGCTATASSQVTVSDVTPVAKFTLNKTSVCAREDVTFTDQSDNATFWCWDFGDGGTGTGKVVSHSYTEPGIYTVMLTAKNGGCSSVKIMTNVIEVKNPLVKFEIKEKNCSNPYKIEFNNLSANYDTLKWDFGDGRIVKGNPPDHTYLSTGNYEVKLMGVNNSTGCKTQMGIPVFIQDIRADFEMDNPKPCKGVLVNFTDKSEFATRWEWVFGTELTSGQQHPSAAFNKAGAASITLTVYDTDGCADQKVLPISVLDIQGGFSFNASSTCKELTVQFTDLSTATPPLLSWFWDFGDGGTSTDQDPQHVYTKLGSFPIKLTLTNTEGNCMFLRDDAVPFTNPVPDFFPSKTGACVDEKINMTNTSLNAASFKWNFGNGKTASGIHSQATYQATGNYTVTLSATDIYGCTPAEKAVVIPITKPIADFDAFETSSECPPLTSIFQDKSTGNVAKWNWSFGDGQYSILQSPAYTYLKPGSFDVQLIATDVNGCKDTTVVDKLINIGGPYGNFSSPVPGSTCIYQTIPFTAVTTNAVVHRWDYGDGTVEDTQMESKHKYESQGTYNTSLVLIDDKGCTVVAEGDVKIIVHDTTAIDFKYSPSCIFQSESFLLKATAAESDITLEWIIENTLAGEGEEFTVAPDTAGEHHVMLRATNQYGCRSEISQVVPVHGNISFIPNVFTPNGDEYNESFMVKDLEKSKWDLEVFNRWGRPVYKKDNYNNNWDATGLAAGVYYYTIVNSFCKDRSYKGIISVLR